MRLTKRWFLFVPTRRNWCPTIFVILIFCLMVLSWLLYNCLTLLERDNLFFIQSFKSQVRQEILKLNAANEIQFQGEESIASLSDVSFVNRQHIPAKLASKAQTDVPMSERLTDSTITVSNYSFDREGSTGKLLFIFGHYEQLGKTTVNFFHAGVLAKQLERDIVIPFVRNSRFCGFPSGWTGPLRKVSRHFLPLDNYFDMKSLETLFRDENFAKLSSFREYEKNCFARKRESVVVYFIYAGQMADDKRYLNLNNNEYNDLLAKMKLNNGWTRCLFIANRLATHKRMEHLEFSSAICVNPELLRNVNNLKNLVDNFECLSIFQWRGVGYERTHFDIILPNSHDAYLSRISVSSPILNEAKAFIDTNFHDDSYLAIHLRSERQLVWYGIEKLVYCMSLIQQVLDIIITKKKIKHIFIASDLEEHGSDVLHISVNNTVLSRAKNLFQQLVHSKNAVTYTPDKKRGLIHNDSGFVALVQMEILSRSKDMITLGAGTFQGWMVTKFKKYRRELKTSWSLTHVCSTEIKNYNSLKNYNASTFNARTASNMRV